MKSHISVLAYMTTICLHRKPMPDDADLFLAEMKRRDPERYAALADRYPVISARAKRRDRRGRTYAATDKREPLSDDARQRYVDQREDRLAYIKEWRLDAALAKELADEGL